MCKWTWVFPDDSEGNPMDRGPGRLQSMGSQRAGYDLGTKQQHSSRKVDLCGSDPWCCRVSCISFFHLVTVGISQVEKGNHFNLVR